MWKAIAVVFPLLLVAGVVALVATKPAENAGSLDTLIYARSTDATTLDPPEILYGEDAKVTENIYETLVAFKRGSLEVEPRLCTAMPQVAEDGRTWTIDLRTDVSFQDGTPMDAAAVEFSFRRFIEEKHPHRPEKESFYRELYLDIEQVKATGPHQVTFTLRESSAVFLQKLAMFPVGIVSPTAVKKFGKDFRRNPVGTGPYKLAEWRDKEKLVLERHEGYWGSKPAARRAIFLPVKDAQTALQMLRNGEVHIVDHMTLADIQAVESDPDLYVARQGALNVAYLAFNMVKPPYNDPRFREAVALAIDRKVLNELVYYGLAEPARNIVPPVVWSGTAELEPYAHDPDKARELLSQLDLGDEPLELWHMTFARPYMPEPHRVAEFIKDQLSRVGLDLKLQGFEKAAYTNKTKDRDHPMALLGWNADYADADNFYFPLLHGEAGDGLNISFFNHAEFNSVVKAAQTELDRAKRDELYLQAAGLYRGERPTLSLVHVPQLAAVSKKVSYQLHPLEYRLYDATFSP